ncbi:hypothetical protein [Rhodoferax sp.]|uniref:hypothetical protein n=1 Tax=Rhodoferax sp. TaxID=50421 RepID=UPI002762413F|nr:hypothetical protein [Rhodoferax sp.]
MNRKSLFGPMLGGLVSLIAVSAALHAAERGVATDGIAYVPGVTQAVAFQRSRTVL